MVFIESFINALRYGQVFTPDHIAQKLVKHADLAHPYLNVLEPSIGKGHLATVIKRHLTDSSNLIGIEIDKELADFSRMQGFTVFNQNFLQVRGLLFDRIVASPPFVNKAEYEHIKHMYSLLSPKGRLVSTVNGEVLINADRKTKNFRSWLDSCEAEILNLPDQPFKEFGSSIEAKFIIINKL